MFEQADNFQEVFGAVEAAEVVGFAGVEGLLVVAGGVS